MGPQIVRLLDLGFEEHNGGHFFTRARPISITCVLLGPLFLRGINHACFFFGALVFTCLEHKLRRSLAQSIKAAKHFSAQRHDLTGQQPVSVETKMYNKSNANAACSFVLPYLLPFFVVLSAFTDSHE